MTICHKFDEAITMKSQNQSFIANRPSFMITDILSKAAVDKPVNMQEHSEHLKHLERFSAFSDGRLALHHGFGMMTHPSQGKPTFYDSEDDFHGSDDVDGGSSDGEQRVNLFMIFVKCDNFFGARKNLFFDDSVLY